MSFGATKEKKVLNHSEKKKRASEDEMAGWHHQCNEHELRQTPEDGEGQGGLVCFSLWGRKESDMTWQLNNSYRNHMTIQPETTFPSLISAR